MPDLPPTNTELHALGHLARALEKRLPGLLDEWVDALQDEALLNEIIRMRGPRESEVVKTTRSIALAWAKHVRLVTLAHLAVVMPRSGRRAARPRDSGSSL